MSLLILVFLFGIGLIPIAIMRGIKLFNSSLAREVGSFVIWYIKILFFASIACSAFGAFEWLKTGVWLTLSPEYFIEYLENENSIRETLLSETSWLGVQEFGNWYLHQNLGWSFLVTIVVIFVASAIEEKSIQRK